MKEKYYVAMKNYNGRFDEIAIGEAIGLNEDMTRKIISMLLSEYKIEFVTHGVCNYRIKKTKKLKKPGLKK